MRNIRYYQNNPHWKRSLGEALDKIHFRNGHYHAVCDPVTGLCNVHQDRHDPHESLESLLRHMWDSDVGKGTLVGGGLLLLLLTAALIAKRK